MSDHEAANWEALDASICLALREERIAELEHQVATLREALARIEAMAERPRCVCGRLTGTAAIQSCARAALGAADAQANG